MSEDKLVSWQQLEPENDFNKNLLFLHDLVICPSCGTKARIKMEAIE